ncbi:MAG: methyl-accepting chemotaxis protein [Pseudomonadota bacterium]
MDKKLSLSFTGSNASWLVYGLAALTVAAGVFVVVTITRLADNAADERIWLRLASDVQVNSQRLSKSAVEAALGNLGAFNQLEATHRGVNAAMSGLRSGDPSGGLPPAPAEVAAQMSAVNATWSAMSMNAQTIISSEALVNELSESGATFLASINNLQATTNRVLTSLVESGAPNQQVFAAGRMMTLSERMHRGVQEILSNGGTGGETAQALRDYAQQFESWEAALRSGNASMGLPGGVVNQQAIAALAQVRNVFGELKPQLDIVLESSVNLEDVRLAADAIFLDSERLFDQAGQLVEAVAALPRSRTWPSTSATTLGLVLLIMLLAALIGMVIVSARRRADTAFKSNRRTQQSIVRLLDELSCLADGDLTARATVSDEVTGAIADAVNFAVEQLRELVRGINETAHAVADSAETTRKSTSQLAQSANEQAGQVARATEKIQAMSTAFGTMAERCKESSETALESVDVAKNGAVKVRETIEGMDTIREQIQETSKRIKRLGESTQEIGDIVKLINDIAEQTNVLALNAAIQAASAGGSGQGFGVVADEVQQLAESATNATKRISGLVQTIQVDTAEAVKSMEATTTEVVNGAHLAHDAGVALVQTEKASTELSNLVKGVSDEAQTYSEQAGRISELMDGIRNVSVKTSKGTNVTAGSVAELAELVMHLQSSVADFKLPESEDAPDPVGAEPETVAQDLQETAPEPAELPEPEAISEATLQLAEASNPETEEPESENDLPLGGAAREAARLKREGTG